MKCTFLPTIAIVAACRLAAAATTGGSDISDMDKAFLDAMASTDMTEVELSRLATAQPLSSPVRDFAQTIAADHGENYQALLALCAEKNYSIVPRIDATHGEVMGKLRVADSPQAAERAYLDAIATDQARIDSLLEQIAGNSNDAQIARFAADTLTAVKNHEDSVRQLASK